VTLTRLKQATLALGVLLVSSSATPQGQASDDLARRQYESGRTFVQNGRFTEALKDFQSVVDAFPQSSYADDALLDVATYQLEIARDYTLAQGAVDRLLKDYPGSDSAPMAYVLTGRLTVAKSRTPASVDTALASFERVPRLFPSSQAVAAARFYTGDTLRQMNRTADALPHFRGVIVDYPRTVWAARAELALAPYMIASGRATQAFAGLQRIREWFPAGAEATTALNFNTILYRLYLRKPVSHAFSGRFIGTEKDRFRDVTGVSVEPSGRVLLGHKQGVTIFDPAGTVVRTVASPDPSAFFADGERIVVIRDGILLPEKAAPIAVSVTSGSSPRQLEDIPAVITLGGGDRLAIDRKGKAVVRLSAAGKYVTNFVTVNAERLARNDFDEVAMIDRDSKGIVIADRDGKIINRIAAKGTGYQFEDPADLAFDGLGHLYVLDGRKAAIYVFSPGPKSALLGTIVSAGKEVGALQKPRALAIDAAGRLFVFDESSQRIQVYQ
jgi:TolA-binding protein